MKSRWLVFVLAAASVASCTQLGIRAAIPEDANPPHLAPDLEHILLAARPPDTGGTADSMSADVWGDPLLIDALRHLDVDPGSAVVATAIWADSAAATLYRVRGPDPSDLDVEFGRAVVLPPGIGKWADQTIFGARVHWAERPATRDEPSWVVAYWVAANGLVVHAFATRSDQAIEMVTHLPQPAP